MNKSRATSAHHHRHIASLPCPTFSINISIAMDKLLDGTHSDFNIKLERFQKLETRQYDIGQGGISSIHLKLHYYVIGIHIFHDS